MPVKWDAEKDKFILNALLLDPTITIGNAVIDTICSTWPADFGDAPTRKAVTEHFFKIRKMNKKYTDGGSNGNGGGTSTPTGTPSKVNKARATPAKKTNGTKTPTSKRKRNALAHVSDGEGGDEDKVAGVPKTELDGLEAVDESPTKRARVAVKYEESDDEGAENHSGSEFENEEV